MEIEEEENGPPRRPPEILNARKIELFELMNCLKQWGVSPFVLALQNEICFLNCLVGKYF